MPSIKVINGTLDIIEIDGEELFAVTGRIDPDSMKHIQVPKYQREILSRAKIENLKDAFRKGRVPVIELGMRGEKTLDRDGHVYLQDPVYVVDGLQRVTAAKELVDEGFCPTLTAQIHLGTTEEWEQDRFEVLNIGQTGLSSNVTLRNLATRLDAAAVMLRITSHKDFVLCDQVNWGQNMRRGDKISAVTYYKVAGRLHAHAGPGKSNKVIELATGLGKIVDNVGKNIFAGNVKAFFKLVDEVWGVANVAYRNEAVQLKSAFLLALASVVSDHENFWDGDRLAVPDHIKRKLSSFPLMDPHIKDLAGSSGQAGYILQARIVDHINAGKRTRRLTKRSGLGDGGIDFEDAQGE